MKTLIKRLLIPILLLFLGTIHLHAQGIAVDFIENKGQWQEPIRYKGVLNNGAFFLNNNGFTVVQHNSDDLMRLATSVHGHTHGGENTPVFENHASKNPLTDSAAGILHSHAYTTTFIGGSLKPAITPDKIQPGYNNYFIGDDASKWASDCKLFQAVTYKDVYPGIDVRYYSESGNLKYEFIVHPGADPGQIALKFDGVDKLSIKNSELIISTSVGELKELYPYTYQYIGTERKKIDARYQLNGNVVKFNIKNFSKQSTLIIDPTLIFASFTGSTADNWGYTATYGKDGTFYAGGLVFDTGFPASPGAYQSKFTGTAFNEQMYWNMGIMKFSSNGSQRLYATYLGGNKKDQPHSLFADSQGNLVVAGRTTSDNFPATTSLGPKGGWDIVVAKFNATGTALLGSVRIGGTGDDGYNTSDSHSSGPMGLVNNYGDDARSEVILDGGDNIYLASCTQSKDFYTTPNAVQTAYGGVQDGVLIKINPACTAVVYSSYFGGANYDAGFVLSLNPVNNDIYMAGGTMSNNLPGNKIGSYQSAFGGVSDGYVAVFSNDGAVLKQTTYMGTPGMDIIFGIQFDRNAYPYIMGITSGNWPVINAAYSNPNSKQFISKLKKDLSGFEYSTVFGTGSVNPNISPVAFLVDRCENVYVSGWGKDIIGKYNLSPITAMPITPDALKKIPDESDFYFIVIQRNASKLLYGTFYGQNGGFGEHVDGGTSRYDQNGVIYQAICACSGGGQGNQRPLWPVTPGAWCCATGRAPVNSGAACNLAALKISFNYAGVGAAVKAYINSTFDTSGCVPLRVLFRDTIRNAKSYEWTFGDGSPMVATDSFEIEHVYTKIGTYRVQMVAIDSTTCNIRDTSYISVIVRDDIANLKMNATKLPPCESLSYLFENLSTAPANKPFGARSFVWDFGDGVRVAAGLGNVTHAYVSPGTYKVRLVLVDTNYCNSPDSLVTELRVSPQVKAQFSIPAALCAPFNGTFQNTSLAGQSFFWDFGDGTTSTEISPKHVYPVPGTFTVKLLAIDPNTCNIKDSTQTTVTVQASPTAAFTVTPTVPAENTPHVFTNNSSANAVRFKWIWGDGDSLVTVSRSIVDHQYNVTGTFNACLVAFNQAGCSDTVCTEVKTIVSPRLDVPNAFTPQGSAQNNTIYVKGFAIAKMRFMIYNRLGQKVFESNDINLGWDGKFNGVYQPMDVYAYTLEVEFTDGTKASKKGDITLLR